jgi:hypothetical protein
VRPDKNAVVIFTGDVEAVVRALLARDGSLTELQITRANLEDAFVELTGPTQEAQ